MELQMDGQVYSGLSCNARTGPSYCGGEGAELVDMCSNSLLQLWALSHEQKNKIVDISGQNTFISLGDWDQPRKGSDVCDPLLGDLKAACSH